MRIFLADSVLRIAPEETDGNWYFNLASIPLWLTGDTTLVMVFEGQLTFCGRNLSFERALRTGVAKANYLN